MSRKAQDDVLSACPCLWQVGLRKIKGPQKKTRVSGVQLRRFISSSFERFS